MVVDADVERAREGDVAGFERLTADRVDGLIRLAAAIVLDPDAAQDVVQDSLVSAWRHMRDLRTTDAFDAWLRRIVVNHARNAARARRRVRPLAAPPLAPDPSRSVEDRITVAAAMETLGVDHRAVVALHYLEGHPVDAISRLLRIPTGTVKSRLHTARARLRAALEEHDGRA